MPDHEQADLTERFSKSKHLEELYRHQTRDKKGQYVDTFSEEFWKAVEEAAAMGTPIPDYIQLMAIISCGLSQDYVYADVDKHMRRFVEKSHLLYNPMPIMDIVRATMAGINIVRVTMADVPSTSSSSLAVAGTSDTVDNLYRLAAALTTVDWKEENGQAMLPWPDLRNSTVPADLEYREVRLVAGAVESTRKL
ncbi:hypothetical protein M9H77_03363 [Catharanthus roseus]|uniref:Uncharacterized protein n=1 Tax=Catharanthus roseus TaxID=4058 RepID=A0ACC0CB73_CATRO|nr:hypothetical protein M9H77_03363 [Catharanthus roseus]